MKKLYLHMGFPKTGTKSFQMTCKRNLKALEKQGFVYPLFNSEHFPHKDFALHGHILEILFSTHPESELFILHSKTEHLNIFKENFSYALNQYLESNKNIIITAEQLFFYSKEKFCKLNALLAKYNFEIIPIVLVRSPYSYSCSIIQQDIKEGGRLGLKKPFITQSEEITRIRSIYPKTMFLSFREACQHARGPVAFLFEQMGVDYNDFSFLTDNVGISNTVTRIQRALNLRAPFIVNNQLNSNYIGIQHIDSSAFPQKYLLTKQEFEEVKELCEAENAYLREHLGEEFCDKEIKFSEEDPVSKLCIEVLNLVFPTWNEREKEQNILKLYSIPLCLKATYQRYRIASEITFGETKKRYKVKKFALKKILDELSK